MSFPVVLASASPRRKDLLKKIFDEFEILPADADESLLEGQTVAETVERLARTKAAAVFRLRPNALVIGSDTLVALGERILAKPVDATDAAEMLELLSGKTHQVLTGVSCYWPGGHFTFADTAHVTFRDLDKDEIRDYVATGEPLDKAGSYAIQGGASGFVTNLEGDMETVVGLPIKSLYARLEDHHLK